jgi:hypothetical protein
MRDQLTQLSESLETHDFASDLRSLLQQLDSTFSGEGVTSDTLVSLARISEVTQRHEINSDRMDVALANRREADRQRITRFYDFVDKHLRNEYSATKDEVLGE